MGFGSGYAPARDTSPRYKEGKRQKQVFGSHANTAHVWANREFSYGRASDGRIFFHGPTIYSYGNHFPMAHFTGRKPRDPVTGEAGPEIVLYNADSYSVSTSAHQGETRHALRGLGVRVIHVEGLANWRGDFDKPTTPQLRAVFDSLLTSYARTMAPSDLQDLESFARAYRLKFAIPRDPVAWLAAREAAAAKKVRDEKIASAKRTIDVASRNAEPVTVPGEYARCKMTADSNVWQLEQAQTAINRDLTKLRSARLALGKNAFPTYKAKARKVLAMLTPALEPLAELIRVARIRETRERDIKRLDELAAYLAKRDESEEPAYCRDGIYSTHDAASLWACAIRENRSDVIPYLQARTHAMCFECESRWRVPPHRYDSDSHHKKIKPEAWQNGIGDASQYSYSATLMRRKGDRLETSRGAVVPWSRAILAFEMAQRCMIGRTTWKRNGEKFPIGPYQLDSVDERGTITAGCHTIEFAESLRLAVREMPDRVRAAYPVPALVS